MILNGDQIRDAVEKHGLIRPFDDAQVQPASYDFRLGYRFATFDLKKKERRARIGSHGAETVYVERPQYLDLAKAEEDLEIRETCAESYVLYPGKSVLCVSQEIFKFPGYLAGTVKAKSSLGRAFLTVSNGDACFFDPGFEGVAVLELRNNGPIPLLLRNGMKIAQMLFHQVCPQHVHYDGNYQTQMDLSMDRWVKALTKVGKNIRSSQALEAMLEEQK